MSDKHFCTSQEASASIKSDDDTNKYTNDALQTEIDLNIQRGNQYGIIGDLYVFILIILLEIFVNYDVGSMAVMINFVKEPYNFSETELGILGALPFFGLIVITTFSGKLLLRFKAQYLCSLGLSTNLVAIVILAVAFHKSLFYIGRFTIGITQAIFVIYAPVWVDTYSPLKYRTLWMGILQGSIIIGTVFGYGITAMLGSFSSWGWRYSLCIQAVGLFIQFVLYVILPGNKVNLPLHLEFGDSKLSTIMSNSELSHNGTITRVSMPNIGSGTCENPHRRRLSDGQIYEKFHSPSILSISQYKMHLGIQNQSKYLNSSTDGIVDKPKAILESSCTCNDFFALFKNGMYVPIVITLCALYFELTGIQYWITSYLIRMCEVSEVLVYVVFSVTAVTSPTFGVLFGSAIVDCVAGYDENSVMRILYISFFWSLLCLGCGIIVTFFKRNFYVLVTNIWIVLFFGGCIVPPAMVLSINSVEPRLRALASSVSAAMYNIFGYMAGSILPGYVADIVGDFTAIIYVIFLWAVFGTFGMFVCILVKLYQKSKKNHNNASTCV